MSATLLLEAYHFSTEEAFQMRCEASSRMSPKMSSCLCRNAVQLTLVPWRLSQPVVSDITQQLDRLVFNLGDESPST